jgi:hypothetical protein
MLQTNIFIIVVEVVRFLVHQCVVSFCSHFQYKPRGALPLTKCCFFHSLLWVRRILGGMGGGGLKKGGNAPQAMESQRCKSSASR